MIGVGSDAPTEKGRIHAMAVARAKAERCKQVPIPAAP